jgi:alpha-1,3-rhamnosyl/mannosyltransferase
MTRVFLDFRVRRGGIGRYGSELIAAIEQLPEAPELDVFDRGPSHWSRLFRAPFTPWGRWSVFKAARESSAAIIHGLHVEVPKSNPIPAVATIHDLIPLDFPDSMPSSIRRAAYRRIVRSSMRTATRIIVPSEATASTLIRRGCEAEKIVVIPHGVNARFRPLTELEREHARRRFGGGKPYLAATVSPKRHKNIQGLRDAAALVSEKTGMASVCNGSVSRLPRPLHSVGWLTDEELRSFYGGAEVFLLPSLLEGFGLPALEALACGVPVVCGSDIGALPYIRPGVIEVDIRRAGEIADAAIALVQDGALRDRLSQAGLLAAKRLSVAATAKATVEVYREILGEALGDESWRRAAVEAR